MPLSKTDHITRAYTYLHNLSHPTFRKAFVGQILGLKRVFKLIDTLLALIPPVAEPSEITHFRRRSPSARH